MSIYDDNEILYLWEVHMLRIAICDDEKIFLMHEKKIIKNILLDLGYECEIDKYTSGVDFLNNDKEIGQYDIVFLDVNMEELDGVATAKRIRVLNEQVFIVFISAYCSYSLEGYKVDAIRYIIKDDKGFEDTLKECLHAIICKMKHNQICKSFRFQEGNVDLDIDKVIYIESNLHKLIFHVNSNEKKEYIMYDRLDNIQIDGFCRIHKSYLINLKYVSEINRYYVVLADNTELSIAKTRYPSVKNAYINYRGKL